MVPRVAFAVGLLIAIAGSPAHADPQPPPLDAAIKKAAAADKLLVVELGAAWCHACKQFAATMLPNARVKQALETVTFVQYDVDDDDGGRAAAKYGVQRVPTFIVIDQRGAERTRLEGAPLGDEGVQTFVHWIGAAPSAGLHASATR